MPRGTVVSRFLIPNAAREDPGKTQKHYSGWSVSFKQHTVACKPSSEGMFLARDLKAQPGSKPEAENEERLEMFTAEGTTLRMRGEAAMVLQRHWHSQHEHASTHSLPNKHLVPPN